MKPFRFVSLLLVVVGLGAGLWVGLAVPPVLEVTTSAIDVQEGPNGPFYLAKGGPAPIDHATVLSPAELEALDPALANGRIVREGEDAFGLVSSTAHFGIWSLLPAAVAIGLCLVLREPLVALLAGIVTAALMLGRYDLTEDVLVPSLASTSAAGVLLLYLWLLGGLMGVWSRTGAAAAFAAFATRHLVRGPRSAKLVAWGLGVLFFQGGSVSTVLVGTSVRPIADEQKVSHEELSYIVDSTAAPIAILLAFNAWPIYIETLIFVPGVAELATTADRLKFFFSALPLSFYAWFAVAGTFLLSIDRLPRFLAGRGLIAAAERARTTGQLDRPGAQPMAAEELRGANVPEGYRPSVWEFALPLVLLTAVAVGTFAATGSPEVRWAFGAALLLAAGMALAKGMSLQDLMGGVSTGLKGVVVASVILLLAINLGSLTRDTGGGTFLVTLLGGEVPPWLLPPVLMLLSMVIAFATGTSWGTFAVAFPLAMPLAVSVGEASGTEAPLLYLSVCFAAVLNGSVFGDQCSPISDTTILSSVTTGADLIDHVKTQLVPATWAAGFAAVGWVLVVLVAT